MSKTPDYILIEDYTCYMGPGDPIILKAGSFARPLEPNWVPEHVKTGYRSASPSQVHCYTHYGIIPVPKKLLRKV